MIQPIERQIDELVCLQINTLHREGSLSQPEVTECLERLTVIKQLYRDLDRSKKGIQAPWIRFD